VFHATRCAPAVVHGVSSSRCDQPELFAGRIGLWQSPDGGASWTNRRRSPITGALTNFALNPLSDSVYVAGAATSSSASRDFVITGTTVTPITFGNVDNPLPINRTYTL